jgi:hypothetical protein
VGQCGDKITIANIGHCHEVLIDVLGHLFLARADLRRHPFSRSVDKGSLSIDVNSQMEQACIDQALRIAS